MNITQKYKHFEGRLQTLNDTAKTNFKAVKGNTKSQIVAIYKDDLICSKYMILSEAEIFIDGLFAMYNNYLKN